MRSLIDVIETILNGTEEERLKLQRSYFEIADTPKELAEIGLNGQKFTIRYGVITHHKNKDSDHDFSADEWRRICAEIAARFCGLARIRFMERAGDGTSFRPLNQGALPAFADARGRGFS